MSRRIEKFAKKLDGEVRGRLFDEQKERMVAKEKQPTEDLVAIELKVKGICDGEPLMLIYYYIIFGKEMYRISNHHTGETLINEAVILEEKWHSRGLSYIFLEKIKEIFIKINPFLLDISLLDGNDRLS